MHIYRDILKRAWSILWRHPWLWIFGLFAALVGNGNEYNSLFSAIDKISNEGTYLAYLQDKGAMGQLGVSIQNATNLFWQSPLLFTWMLLLAALVGLAIVWIITVARASIIHAVGSLEAGTPTGFSRAATGGARFFWPIFVLNVLTKFFVYLVLIVALLPFFIVYLAGGSLVGFSMMVIISFIIFIPLALAISFILKYAAIYVVLEQEKWWHALERATSLFFRNWLVSLEMAALLFLVNLVVSLVLLFLLIPDVLTIKQELIRSAFAQSISPIVIVRLLLAVLLFVVTGTWYAIFDYASWVILFRRLHGEGIVPKIVRTAQATPAYLKQWWS